jgi:1,5-anhydro-D-fructose reductase (1,5-anhydro-D-mannitol-forming)
VLKVGIVGFGKMGQIRYEEIIKTTGTEVICIYEPGNIDKLPSDVRKMDTADSVINSEEVDVIFICTPNFLNMPLTIQALENGKHVFCEKPPAFSAEDVRKIMEVERKSGKKLMYGFNHRHHGSVKKMKAMISSGEFGDVLWMRGRYGKSVDSEFYRDWRSDIKKSGGGILIDQGIHMLDLFLYLGGDFNKIHASVSNLYWDLEVEDNVFATLENSNTGVVASLHSTMTQWRHLFSLEVFLKKGYMVLNGLRTSSMTYGDETLSIAKNRSMAPTATWEDEELFSYLENDSWASEVEEFFDTIQEDKVVWSGNSDDALRVMTIVDKIYEYKNKEENGK